MSKRQKENQKATKYKDTDLVLNYHDAVIYGSDLRLLQSRTEWLNDSCILFFFALLQHSDCNLNYLFVDPSVTSFFIHQCIDQEDIEDFVANTSFPSEGKVFIPVNDNMAVSSSWQIPKSGNHWSLLVAVISCSDVQFWHFDSIHGSGNIRAANDIVEKLCRYVFLQAKPEVVQASTPQQSNGYDCAIHMLAATKLFSAMTDTALAPHETRLLNHVSGSPDFCTDLRDHIAAEILRIAADS